MFVLNKYYRFSSDARRMKVERPRTSIDAIRLR